MKTLSRIAASLFCSLALLATPAAAAKKADIPTQELKLSAEQKALVTKVEAYLTSLDTIVADFMQVAPDGSLVGGKFYLQRPGRMRWQYNPPTPILMISDGRSLIFHDYELDQTSYIPLEDTLAGFLARKDMRFGGDVVITAVEEGPGSLRLSMVQKAKPKDGSLTLELSTQPMQLRNMLVFDATGQQTTVALNNARYGVPLDAKLFIFDDTIKPRIGKSSPRGLQR